LGEIALKIRQLGAPHAVPIVEAAPLARALYRHVDLDQEIPATLYAAVAEVLAYIYQLSNWRLSGGQLSDCRRARSRFLTNSSGRLQMADASLVCGTFSLVLASGNWPGRC
jgi:hypothetical protein